MVADKLSKVLLVVELRCGRQEPEYLCLSLRDCEEYLFELEYLLHQKV
jgi:hypothetical protein